MRLTRDEPPDDFRSSTSLDESGATPEAVRMPQARVNKLARAFCVRESEKFSRPINDPEISSLVSGNRDFPQKIGDVYSRSRAPENVYS